MHNVSRNNGKKKLSCNFLPSEHLERIAIMAALNIAHEYLTTKVGGFDMGEIKRRMTRMETVIDQAMSEQAKLF